MRNIAITLAVTLVAYIGVSLFAGECGTPDSSQGSFLGQFLCESRAGIVELLALIGHPTLSYTDARNEVASANYCNSSTDCVVVSEDAYCPPNNIIVNRTEAERVQKMLAGSHAAHCDLLMPVGDVVCSNSRCRRADQGVKHAPPFVESNPTVSSELTVKPEPSPISSETAAPADLTPTTSM
jgi:hypothetical protein